MTEREETDKEKSMHHFDTKWSKQVKIFYKLITPFTDKDFMRKQDETEDTSYFNRSNVMHLFTF